MGFAGTGLQYLLVDILQLKEMLPYFICYGIGIGLDILTVLIIFFENEEPLEYEEKKKKERKETKKLREKRKGKRSQWELVE